ncbi:hypothetical protein L332_11015 [Agrococcus pavilionensis RW1]|uniref:Uncharacterized protein n=1 Tax=Agrococcus pavilionensis RW1 TaxID=1330458 RepID=U1MWI3_9MICO|nr:hypothetical protein [Agrococcus pavilionensis]ERG64970.1 hypothetical protein L332_11015 [Agrococcus pavilionensis RW1]
MTPAPRDERLDRRRRAILAALVVTVVTTALTGSAHAIGGGSPPDALLLGAAAVLTLVVLAPVLGARGLTAALPRQALAVTAAQLLQHALYAVPESSAPLAAAAGGHAAHAHGAHSGASLAGAVLHAHAAMPLAHLVAGALALGLLRLAPRLVDALLEAVSLRVALAVLAWPGPRPAGTASVAAERRASRRALDALRGSLERRGPPLAIA